MFASDARRCGRVDTSSSRTLLLRFGISKSSLKRNHDGLAELRWFGIWTDMTDA